MASGKKKSAKLDKLDPRRRKYVEGRAEGKSKTDAALDAGFSESMARSAVAKIENPDVRAAFQELVRQVIPAKKIVERLHEGLDAHKSYVDKEGESHFETDFRERREYLKLASNFGGYYIDKQEIDHKVNDGSGDRLAELLAAATARVNGGNDAGGKS